MGVCDSGAGMRFLKEVLGVAVASQVPTQSKLPEIFCPGPLFGPHVGCFSMMLVEGDYKKMSNKLGTSLNHFIQQMLSPL